MSVITIREIDRDSHVPFTRNVSTVKAWYPERYSNIVPLRPGMKIEWDEHGERYQGIVTVYDPDDPNVEFTPEEVREFIIDTVEGRNIRVLANRT